MRTKFSKSLPPENALRGIWHEEESPAMTTVFQKAAEQQRIPLRTADEVRTALETAKATKSDTAMARLMLRHGRLTDQAREYIAREYPDP